MLWHKDQASADRTTTAFYGDFDFFFQVCEGFTYLRDPQLHKALFWAESLKGGELSYFLSDLSVNNIFRVAIVQQYFLDPFYFSIESR